MLRRIMKILGAGKKGIVRIVRLLFTKRAALQVGSYRHPLRVNGFTTLTSNTHLGANANFNGLRVLGKGSLRIGDNFHSGGGCLVITDTHLFDGGDAIPYDTRLSTPSKIVIEDNVWLGSRVIVLGNVTIGEGAIIQAGSVVVSDIPKYAIAGGHPAKQFKTRDVAHYAKRKAEGRFS